MLRIGAGLGSDVPPCVVSRPLHVEGRGDAFRMLDARDWHCWPVLLVNPLVPLATGPVFRAWDGQDRGGIADPAVRIVVAWVLVFVIVLLLMALVRLAIRGLLKAPGNAFQISACRNSG